MSRAERIAVAIGYVLSVAWRAALSAWITMLLAGAIHSLWRPFAPMSYTQALFIAVAMVLALDARDYLRSTRRAKASTGGGR